MKSKEKQDWIYHQGSKVSKKEVRLEKICRAGQTLFGLGLGVGGVYLGSQANLYHANPLENASVVTGLLMVYFGIKLVDSSMDDKNYKF